MRKHVLTILMVLLGLGSSSMAQMMTPEIICKQISPPGSADNGLEIIIQSNSYSWIKLAYIFESGYLGRREIGRFQIPLQPKLVFDIKESWTANYEAKDFKLKMKIDRVRTGNGYYISGPSSVAMRLPQYQTFQSTLICKQVK